MSPCEGFFTWVAVFIILGNAGSLKGDGDVSIWNDCGGADKVIHFEALSISPLPLSFPGSARITLNVKTSGQMINPVITLTVIRETLLGDIRFPCVFNIGSCNYTDICALLETIPSRSVNELFKSKYVNQQCVVESKGVNITDYTVHLPKLPLIVSLFASAPKPAQGIDAESSPCLKQHIVEAWGSYRLNAQLFEKLSGRQLGCVNVNLSVRASGPDLTG